MKFRNQAFLFTPAVLLAWFLLAAPVAAQFAQQGTKLIGTGAIGDASQGWSASLSYDGNTAIVGGIGDSGVGAAWVFTRSGGVWSQQAKLVGTGSIGGEVAQGISVSLSGDGNTALVGGPYDNNFVGAAWVFTRSGGVWSQQAKLVGTGSIGPGSVFQGWSGSLSRDGNTALVGGYGDNGLIGAAWVYTRSGGVWSQQAKLVGTGNGAFSAQGVSASLSGDGNTALVGGSDDSDLMGAAWVFIRSSAGVWSQQGPKLVGTGAIPVSGKRDGGALLYVGTNTVAAPASGGGWRPQKPERRTCARTAPLSDQQRVRGWTTLWLTTLYPGSRKMKRRRWLRC